MASIAYVTDQRMIEYHRLHGNRFINFWRPSNARKIADFHHGDLLFFLAKGTEHGPQKEKGLIGYGKLKRILTMPFHQMWNSYKEKNGYASKDKLLHAIQKITKEEALPEAFTCIELEDVVYFQYPIYLSEVHMQVSNSLESYCYLDKEQPSTTTQLLKLAEQIGEDIWTSSYQQDTPSIEEETIWQTIYQIQEQLQTDYYTRYEQARIHQYILQLQDSNIQPIKESRTLYYQKDALIKLYLPCLLHGKNVKKHLMFSIGYYQLFQAALYQAELTSKVTIQLLLNQKPMTALAEILDALHIAYEERII